MSASEWRQLLERARRGDAEAAFEVAERYEEGCRDRDGGVSVRRSMPGAVEWYRRSAERGHTGAQICVGVCLTNGAGVKKDVAEGLSWLRRAYRAGLSCAAYNIAVTYRQNGDFRRAVHWFRTAAARGDFDAVAHLQLGIHYYWGKGVRTDARAAVRCFRKAAKGESICEGERDDAFFYLGIAHLEGKGVRRSVPGARKLFQRANVDGDHPAAARMLRLIEGGFERR